MDLAIVIAVVAVALVFDYTNGFHDAANAIATSVSTRALTPRIALILAAVFWTWWRVEGTLAVHAVTTWRRELFYWAAVAATFATGTAVGDLSAITWHAGYQTPDQQYAAVEQGQDAPAAWVRQQTNRAPADGTQEVAGESWQRYTGGRVAQNSLVHTRGRVTTIVTGTAGYDDLALLAESLRPPG